MPTDPSFLLVKRQHRTSQAVSASLLILQHHPPQKTTAFQIFQNACMHDDNNNKTVDHLPISRVRKKRCQTDNLKQLEKGQELGGLQRRYRMIIFPALK
jgi:hypothetical protein